MYFLMLTDEITQLPAQVPVIKPDLDRANPKIGISAMAFSADNRYLATKNGEIMSVMCIGVQKSNLTNIDIIFFLIYTWNKIIFAFVEAHKFWIKSSNNDGKTFTYCIHTVNIVYVKPQFILIKWLMKYLN